LLTEYDSAVTDLFPLANQMFSRASGAPLQEGNAIRLLKDAAENYPAWASAIASARRTIHVEMYVVHDDDTGRRFADALIAQAQRGVRVRVIYDWFGGLGNTRGRFWRALRAAGVEVRVYNPPGLESPFGWVSRDHRKVIVVDGCVAFVSGLCVGDAWSGDPARGRDPWRDTGVEVRGAAVAEIEQAFADSWAATGPPLPPATPDAAPEAFARAPGAGLEAPVSLRVVASVPNTAGILRMDELVAALARQRLWLTDAYYAGTTPYVQALRAAARDGVDVRLLVPGSSDVPVVSPLSRAGYRPLLEAGVRIFEWNGSMLHAKTAVADDRWARVGSTNLNLTSWIGNRELDVVVEDAAFARAMAAMYEVDLGRATEIVLVRHARVRAQGGASRGRPPTSSSGGRALAGAMRIGNTVSAAMTNRRVLEPVEAHIALLAGVAAAGLTGIGLFFPRSIAYPVAVVAAWFAGTLLLRGVRLLAGARRGRARDVRR